MAAWNREFGSAFVPCCEGDRLDDILMAVRHGKRVLRERSVLFRALGPGPKALNNTMNKSGQFMCC